MPEQPPTLRDMIQEALDNGTTYRQLEARAVDPVTQKTASRSVFFDTVNEKLDRMPFDYHLRAIAASLGVPYERVRQAAIRQWLPPEEVATRNAAAERQQLIDELTELRDRTADALARLEDESADAAS